ncbi:MAG: M16 family metallopeptidase [Chlorobiales bacterium]
MILSNMQTRGRFTTSTAKASQPNYVEQTVLPNGLTVITEYVPTVRSVAIGLWTETGSRDETKESAGISHFIEHLVFKGTKKRDYIEISKSLERVGGYLNAFTSKENTCFYARVLDEYSEVAVDVLTDLVFNPTFPQKELEKEKDVVIEEIKSADDTPDDAIFEDFDKFIYNNHPFALPIAGTQKTVRSFTRKKVIEHLESFYTTDKMILAAAGNLKHSTLVKLAEKYVPKSRQSLVRKREQYDVGTYKAFEKEIAKPISQAHAVTGFPFERNDENFYAVLLLNMILGGGMSSRLNLELREKHGLAYSVFSNFNSGDEVNLFNIYIGTDANKVQKSLALIRREIEKIADKLVPEKELELNKAQLKGGIIMSQENMSARMNHLARDLYYFGRFRSDTEVLDAIDAVSPKHIRAVAESLFKARPFSTLVYMPKKKK